MIWDLILLIVAIIFILSIIGGCIWCYLKEKKDYNNGICPLCGGKLVRFTDDSQGSKGYICSECFKYSTWVSWFNPRKNKGE